MKKFLIYAGLILLGYFGYRNYSLNKQLSQATMNPGSDRVGKRIPWSSGETKVHSFAQVVLNNNLPFNIPVYIEFDETDEQILHNFLEYKLNQRDDTLRKLRAYYALETGTGAKPVLSLVFVPANSISQNLYSEDTNCCVYNLGVPCPPDCATGRLTSTNPSSGKGALMALRAYGENRIPPCLIDPPGANAMECPEWPVSNDECNTCSPLY